MAINGLLPVRRLDENGPPSACACFAQRGLPGGPRRRLKRRRAHVGSARRACLALRRCIREDGSRLVLQVGPQQVHGGLQRHVTV